MKCLILVITEAGAWLSVDGGLGQDQGEAGEAGHHPSQRHPRHHHRAITINYSYNYSCNYSCSCSHHGHRVTTEQRTPASPHQSLCPTAASAATGTAGE